MRRPKNQVETPVEVRASLDLQGIKGVVRANQLAGRPSFEGLDSADIGRYNQALMFGDHGEGFPDQAEWSRIVD